MFRSPMGTHGEIDEYYSDIPLLTFIGKMEERA